jgi:transketolase
MHTAKPISEEYIKKISINYKYIVTVEEHSKIGGFGDAIRDMLDKIKFIGKFHKIGAQDKFISKNGSHEYAREEAKIDHLNIFHIIKDLYSEEDIKCI